MKSLRKLAAVAVGVASVGLMSCPAQARNPFGNVEVQSVVQSNFATRQAQLRNQIQADVSSGRLHPSVASSLLAQLDQINAQTQGDVFRGGVSNGEANRIVAMFASVTDQLNASEVGATAFSGPAGFGVTPAQARAYQLRQRINARLYPRF